MGVQVQVLSRAQIQKAAPPEWPFVFVPGPLNGALTTCPWAGC
jgi:hypothetical protein